MSIVDKLNQADFRLRGEIQINDEFDEDFYPLLISEDGIIVEFINDASTYDEIFEKMGKLIALEKYIELKQLHHKYSVLLAIDLDQYTKIHKDLRNAIHRSLSIIIL